MTPDECQTVAADLGVGYSFSDSTSPDLPPACSRFTAASGAAVFYALHGNTDCQDPGFECLCASPELIGRRTG